MNFGKNLRYLRRMNNYSQPYLAQQLGYTSFTTIQKWEDGTAVPPYKTIKKISELFNVDIEDIMNVDLSARKNTEIPVLGIVRGGAPIFADQNYIGFEHVYPDDSTHGNCFYLEVVGDSMRDARILPGDLIYVRQQDYLDNGDIGVILIDNEATVKYVRFKDDVMILEPANENYKPIILTKEDQVEKQVRIIGKVLHNRIKFS